MQNFPAGNIGPVHGLVAAAVGLHDGAIYAGLGKNSVAARIAEDLRVGSNVRACRCLFAQSFMNSITTSVNEPPI